MNILAIPTIFGLSKPISGGQNRFSNLIKGLKKRKNKIIVLESQSVMCPEDQKLAKIHSYKEFKFFNRRLTVFRDVSVSFILEILKILKNEKIDIIQITHPSGIFAAKLITKLTQNKIPLVYDAHNVESNHVMEVFTNNPKYSRLEKLIFPAYIKFIEKIVCKYIVNHITSVSEKEREKFTKRYKLKKEKITVVPSGCHIPELPDKKCKNDIKEEIGIDSDKIIIFFHGLFSHSPNKDAFKTIENYIASKFEEVNERVLFVVGGTGVPKFERANIKAVGFIEDLYKVMSIADIAIVPLTRGAGTKLKVMDYLSVGLPIVTTKKGIEGINAKNGEHVIIVDDVNEEFINAIKYLIDNEEERKRISANARKLAEEEYDWDKIGEKLDKLYRRILEGQPNATK
jgi:glycosyltransferase involved in cell wall biosynthesis